MPEISIKADVNLEGRDANLPPKKEISFLTKLGYFFA
jgi:hypothetical protein